MRWNELDYKLSSIHGNEKRKSDILKETYTKQLVNNLEKDIIQLEEYLDLNNFFDNESFYLLDYLVKKNKNPDYYRLTKATFLASNLKAASSNNSVYNELISTGNLKLYANTTFKELMNSYFIDDRQNVDEHLKMELWDRYIQKIIEYVDPLIWRTFLINLKAPKYEGIVELNQYHIDWAVMQNDKELILKLKKGISSRTNASYGIKEFLERARSLKDFIKNNRNNL